MMGRLVRDEKASLQNNTVFVYTHISIPRIHGWMVRVIICHGRRGFVVRSAPAFHLLHPSFRHHLFLVLSDQIAVIAFVQPPALVHGNVFLTKLHECNVAGPNRTSQQTGVHFVKLDLRVGQHLTSHLGFQNTLIGQGSVGPSNETIVPVPCALAVAKETQLKGCGLIETGEGSLAGSSSIAALLRDHTLRTRRRPARQRRSSEEGRPAAQNISGSKQAERHGLLVCLLACLLSLQMLAIQAIKKAINGSAGHGNVTEGVRGEDKRHRPWSKKEEEERRSNAFRLTSNRWQSPRQRSSNCLPSQIWTCVSVFFKCDAIVTLW